MELWAGLAELRADPKCKDFRRFGESKGVFVWIAAWAESQSAFEAKARIMSEGLDCIVYGLEKVGLLDAKMEEDGYPEEFIDMRSTAIRQPLDTVFGTFHRWSQEDTH
jgi:hypothetical protein